MNPRDDSRRDLVIAVAMLMAIWVVAGCAAILLIDLLEEVGLWGSSAPFGSDREVPA